MVDFFSKWLTANHLTTMRVALVPFIYAGMIIGENDKWIQYVNNPNVKTYILKENDELIGYFELIFNKNTSNNWLGCDSDIILHERLTNII